MPPFLVWEEQYSVGLKLVDDQHRRLFDIINDLSALNDRKAADPARLKEMLHRLRDYAFYHFATEEDLMERYRYADVQRHARIHDAFRKQLETFERQLLQPNADHAALLTTVTRFVKEWLQHHVLTEDKKCAPVFEHGNELPLTSS
jgi:hemerythrin-like metal-binding protein